MFRHLFFALFLLSGFSALVYEVVWSQYLKMILGHAAYAQALVLVVFMGGMSLGAWITSRLSASLRIPLSAYLLVEVGLGLMALLFHPLFLGLESAYHALLQLLAPGPVALFGIKAVISTLLVLPQSILLGATFPLLSAVLIRRYPERQGGVIANLYFTNSLGGAIGALVTGFVLVPRLGLPAALGSGGILNLLIAAVAAPFAWQELMRGREYRVGTPHGGRGDSARWAVFLAFAAFVTGCASFLYEIAWIRLLSLVLGASTHAFELMLSAFILGLALGGFWIRRHIDKLANPLVFLGGIQIAMGVLALLSFPLYTGAFYGMEFILKGLARSEQGYQLFQFLSHGVALAVMLPATFFAGATLPLLTSLLMRKGGGERSIGSIYAANTVGAIVGVLLAMFVLVPQLGLKATLIIGAALDVILGFVLLYRHRERFRSLVRVVYFSVPAVVFLSVIFYPQDPLLLNSQVYRRLSPDHLNRGGYQTLYYRDGRTATVFVGESKYGARVLKVNGKVDASMTPLPRKPWGDEVTQILTGAIPLAIDADMKRALVIGFGSGQTTATLLSHPGLEQVDTVEIEGAVVEAGQHFRPTVNATFDDPRSHIHVEDGRSFMALPGKPYDLIVSEPSNPWVSGVAGLFTTEFYRHALRRLAPDGLLVQWLQLYEMDATLVAGVFNALAPHCGSYAVYDAGGSNILVVCARGKRNLNPVAVGLFDYPDLAPALERIGIRTLADFALRRIASDRILGPMFRELSPYINSDFDPLLEYQAPKYHFLSSDVSELYRLQRAPIPLLTLLDPLYRETPAGEVTLSPYNGRSRSIYEIHHWVRNFLQAGADEADRPEPGDLVQLLESTGCETRGSTLGELLFDPVTRFDGSIDLDLTGLFWQKFEAHPCARAVDEETRQWIAFLRAMSRLQVAQMGEGADTLLTGGSPFAERYRPVVLGAAMLAKVAQEEPEQALSLFRRYGEGLNLRSHPYLLALVGLAKERQAVKPVRQPMLSG